MRGKTSSGTATRSAEVSDQLATSANSETIVLVGCGSIGLPFAVALAQAGCAVEAFDIDKVRLRALADGTETLREAALSRALLEVLAAGNLRFVERIEKSPASRCFVLAVPTPWTTGAGFDGGYVSAAVDMIAEAMADGDALLVRSTMPVGHTRNLAARLAAKGLEIDVAAIPDRTVEGKSFSEEFSVPHLAGGITPRATARAVAILERLGSTVALDNPESAEAAKLFSNAARHVLFSLSNEMALLCEKLGLDVHHVLNAASSGYPRFQAPRPGPVGGPCLGKDIGILTGLVKKEDTPIFNAARSINTMMLDRMVSTIEEWSVKGPTKVAILGIAFKGRPAVDDARGSFAVNIAERLLATYPKVALSAWDPVMSVAQICGLGLAAAADPLTASQDADLIILANDHPDVATVDQAAIGRACRKPALVYNITGSPLAQGSGFGKGIAVRTFGTGKERS